MAEYIKPGIRQNYVYQPNVLMCWAAAGLTLWRSKFGKRGRGSTMEQLMNAPGGDAYKRMLAFDSVVNEELGGGTNMAKLKAAESAARAKYLEFSSTPSGLPERDSDAFFTGFLKTKSTALGADKTGEQMKALIKASAPIAIFLRNPGHIKLIVGYWDSEPASPQGPQIIIFNPESYIVEMENTGNPDLDPKTIREERWLWAHWQQYHANNLVGNKGWHY